MAHTANPAMNEKLQLPTEIMKLSRMIGFLISL